MLRVWLDQNKWIDLARAAKGVPQGKRYRDVLELARAFVEAGEASFPLDAGRYMETAKRRHWQSRQELVATMAELSKFHTIAPPSALVPAEIDQALYARYGVPNPPPRPRVFGVGAAHAFGKDSLRTVGRLQLPKDILLPPGWRSTLDQRMQQTLEYGMLLGLHPQQEATVEHQALLARMTQDEQFATARTELARQLTEHGFDKKDKLNRALFANEYVDILDPLLKALLRAGINPDRFFEQGQDGLIEFLRGVPTRSVTYDLMRDKHAQGQQKWEPNDLNDVVYLPLAAVHCDVVVTERQWANRLVRAGVPRQYGTTVLYDLRELSEHLVGSSRID